MSDAKPDLNPDSKPKVILKAEMMPLLIEASPGFKPKRDAFLEDWKNEMSDLPEYLSLGDFASYLAEKIEKNNTEEFVKIFQVIEDFHLYGEPYVKEAVTIGLLEGIQNISAKNSDMFLPYLLPETKRYWNKLNDFWDGKSFKE